MICNQTFTIKGVSKSQTNKYIISVIETNGESHKENDECNQTFTKNRVYKSQTNKYIITIKNKNLKKRNKSSEELQRNQ